MMMKHRFRTPPGPSGVHSQRGQGRVTYLHPGRLGEPTIGTDNAGQIVWRWQTGAFGDSSANFDPDGDGNTVTMNVRFPGQYYDAETGLHYNYHRYYDPATGRYITSDPIGLAGGLNTYGYAGQNPIVNVDPLGLVEWNGTVTGGFLIAAGGFVFELESKECIDGQRAIATVLFAGPGLGLGAQFSATGGGVQLQDSLDFFDPGIFDGVGFISTIGAAIPRDYIQDAGIRAAGQDPAQLPHGGACSAIQIGMGRNKVGAGGYGCGGIFGLDFSALVSIGSSTLIDYRTEPCGECE